MLEPPSLAVLWAIYPVHHLASSMPYFTVSGDAFAHATEDANPSEVRPGFVTRLSPPPALAQPQHWPRTFLGSNERSEEVGAAVQTQIGVQSQ